MNADQNDHRAKLIAAFTSSGACADQPPGTINDRGQAIGVDEAYFILAGERVRTLLLEVLPSSAKENEAIIASELEDAFRQGAYDQRTLENEEALTLAVTKATHEALQRQAHLNEASKAFLRWSYRAAWFHGLRAARKAQLRTQVTDSLSQVTKL